MKNIIYAGTYTARTSKGIYCFDFEDGKASNPRIFAEIHNPKYIAYYENRIISVCDFENGSGVALLNMEGEIIDKIVYEASTSCYVTVKDNRIYTANYHTGTFTVLQIENDKLKLIQTVEIQNGAGCHQVLLWNDQILIPCLFLDRIMIYDQQLNKVGSLRFSHGTGPRHGVFSKDGEYLYLIAELSNELFVIHTGDWVVEQQISILSEGKTRVRDSAAIRLSQDESHLYISTRTLDIISVLSLDNHHAKLEQIISTLGKHPRDFIIHDHYLLCANRNSDRIDIFDLHSDGTIGKAIDSVAIPEAVSLIVG